jgi:hypothetical protein
MNFFSKQRFINLTILVLVLLNMATIAFFWFSRPPFGKAMPENRQIIEKFLIEKLHFTPEQQHRFQQLKEEHQHQTRQIREELRPLKDSFFSHLEDKNLPQHALDSLSMLIGKKSAELDLVTFEHFRAVRNICNDEQKVTFDELIQEVLRMTAPHPPDKNRLPPIHQR